MPPSSELALSDDGAVGPQQGDSPAAPPIVLEPPPPFWMQQTGKAGNVLFNSAIVAMLRGWFNPPKIEMPEAGVVPPEWMTPEWTAQYRNRLLARRVGRDTLAFAAGCYLMDGVEAGMASLRGKKDHYNKIMGGVSAGGLIGFVWYPGVPRARAVVTIAGAMVGLVSYNVEQQGNTYMLEQQRKLEKELLRKPDEQLKAEFEPYYMRSLLRAKQQQLQHQMAAAAKRTPAEAAAAAAAGAGGGGFAAGGAGGPTGRLFGDDGAGNAPGASGSYPGAAWSLPSGSSFQLPGFQASGGGGDASSSSGDGGVYGSGGGAYGSGGGAYGSGGGAYGSSGGAYGSSGGAYGGDADRRGGFAPHGRGGAGGGYGELPNDHGVLVITEEGDGDGSGARSGTRGGR